MFDRRLIIVVGVTLLALSSGCAYQRYMGEERTRSVYLNEQINQENSNKQGIEAHASELKARRNKKFEELYELKTVLAAKRDELERISPVVSASSSHDRAKITAENQRLLSEIAALESQIALKHRDIDALTY